jgi:UDP-N-acetylglucosamine 3-dehydrogenase
MRFGVIGVGHLGKHHARIYREIAGASPDIELSAVVDVLPSRAAEIAKSYGAEALTDYRDLIGKVDAVSLAAPTSEHARIGIELLENGIDVLVEKPMTFDR